MKGVRQAGSLETARNGMIRLLLPLGIFSLVVNLLLLVVPLYMLQIYDRVLPTQSMDTLRFLSIIAVGALVVLGLLEVVRAMMASRAATRMEKQLGADALLTSMMSGRATQGDIQPLRDLASIKQFVSSRAIFNLIDLPFAPLFIAILYLVHPALFLLTLGGAVVLLLLALLNQAIVAKPQRESGEKSMAAQSTAQALTRNSESLRAMGMVESAVNRWGSVQAESMQKHSTVDGRNAVLSGISRTIRMGLQVAILGYGAFLVLGGEMTAGMIFASSIISGRALQPIDQVIAGWRQYVSTWSAWKRMGRSVQAVDMEREFTPMPEPKGLLTAENVTVRNPSGRADQPILDRVSMRLEPGQVLGLLGPSGSGKSTLARVLVGAIVPDAGVVRIDGSDLKNWDPAVLGRQIGYVSQEVELLPGTIASNIARLDPEADPQKLQAAAERAQVMDLIKSLPGGFDTPVGPGGMGLSGGERQRIALARAFYGDPKIVVLDEPNAALDETGERALYLAMLAAKQAGATVVIVSQRNMPVKLTDLVMHLVDGRVDYFGEPQPFYDKREEFMAKRREAAKKEAAARRARMGKGGGEAGDGAGQAAPAAPPMRVIEGGGSVPERASPAPGPDVAPEVTADGAADAKPEAASADAVARPDTVARPAAVNAPPTSQAAARAVSGAVPQAADPALSAPPKASFKGAQRLGPVARKRLKRAAKEDS